MTAVPIHRSDMPGFVMPVNPETGFVNVTPGEVADARAATEDVELVRKDGTLTRAGMLYVADLRRAGWDDLTCPGCQDDMEEHWRSCPRWDDPANGGFEDDAPADPWAVVGEFAKPAPSRYRTSSRSRHGKIRA